ncbi:hypothetical protein EV193_103598 [Herbihabitans rhizosphaerae]|uniref:Beta/gamma crystallin n=1 Tax=Herbihabitans rhizosphaerae TaxID=1872711 RepID=A0A4Q7KXA7_9PSEU|nr:hypothetical protein [Herbihabitans rhizosphaerae]RZS41276.1 hypothetical protein EV193_103598 [Herbihabitans rhizosphaerae]
MKKKITLVIALSVTAMAAGVVAAVLPSAAAAPGGEPIAAPVVEVKGDAGSGEAVAERVAAAAAAVERADATVENVTAQEVGIQGTAPNCVSRTVFKKQHEAYIANGCGKNMRLKVIINNGYDSSCHTLRHGQHFYYWWPYGSYARTVTC